MALECPGCHSEIDPSNTQCPTCLRPISRKEMMQNLNVGRRAEEARRKRPFKIAGAFILLIALGFGVKKAQQMGLLKLPPPPPKPVAAPAPTPAPAPIPTRAPETPAQPTPTAAPAVPEKSGASTAPDEPPAPEGWTITGTVYDLLSLKPAANARLTFENHSSGEVSKTKADGHGRYKIQLPKLTDGGYAVSVAAKGYRGDYLEEASPPYANRTLAGRQEAAGDAAQSAVLHVPIFLDKDTSLEYNLALLPHQ